MCMGQPLPPDATFSLRVLLMALCAGIHIMELWPLLLQATMECMTIIYSYGSGSEWDLPERWQDPIRSFDRSVPLNFTSTNDITGGNSGSPVINQGSRIGGDSFSMAILKAFLETISIYRKRIVLYLLMLVVF